EGHVVERLEVAEAVLGHADGLRPGPHAPGCADDEALEPRLRNLPKTFRRGLVEAARLLPALDVDLERERVLLDGEGARAVAAGQVAVTNRVAAPPTRGSVGTDRRHRGPPSLRAGRRAWTLRRR